MAIRDADAAIFRRRKFGVLRKSSFCGPARTLISGEGGWLGSAVEVLPSTHLEVSHSWEMESATTADIQQTEDTMAPPDGAPTAPRTPPSGTLLRVLTHTQNASAAAFGMFMGIHLAAPIAASFGGTSAADGVMVSGIAGEWFRPGVRPGARCDARHCRHAFLRVPSP